MLTIRTAVLAVFLCLPFQVAAQQCETHSKAEEFAIAAANGFQPTDDISVKGAKLLFYAQALASNFNTRPPPNLGVLPFDEWAIVARPGARGVVIVAFKDGCFFGKWPHEWSNLNYMQARAAWNKQSSLDEKKGVIDRTGGIIEKAGVEPAQNACALHGQIQAQLQKKI